MQEKAKSLKAKNTLCFALFTSEKRKENNGFQEFSRDELNAVILPYELKKRCAHKNIISFFNYFSRI